MTPSRLNYTNKDAAVDISGNTTITGNAKKGKDKINKLNRLDLKNEIKTLKNQQTTARNFDRSTGLDETEADIARLQEIATQQIADAEAAERAKQAIEEANRYGKSQFETLLEIANDNGLNATEFLKAFGFNSLEELKGDLEFEHALADYTLARIDIAQSDMNNIGTIKNPCYTFNNLKGVNATETLGSSTSIWASVYGYDMIDYMCTPYFVHDYGNVAELDSMSQAMIERMHRNNEITEEDYTLLRNVNEAIMNSQFILADGKVIDAYELMKISAINSYPPVNITEERKETDGYALCDYLLFNSNTNYNEKISTLTIRDSNGKHIQVNDESYMVLADLYIAMMKAKGYQIKADKTSKYGLAIFDSEGNKVNTSDKVIIDTLVKIDENLKKNDKAYAMVPETKSILGVLEATPFIDEGEILPLIGEKLEIEAQTKNVLEEILSPFVTTGQVASAGVSGALSYSEHFVDGYLRLGADFTTFLYMLKNCGVVVSDLDMNALIMEDVPFEVIWQKFLDAEFYEDGPSVRELQYFTNDLISEDFVEDLQEWFYGTDAGQWLDTYSLFTHESSTYKLIQDTSETVTKTVVGNLCGPAIPDEILTALYKLGKTSQDNYKNIKEDVDAYNEANGTNLDYNDIITVYVNSCAYADALISAFQKRTNKSIHSTYSDARKELQVDLPNEVYSSISVPLAVMEFSTRLANKTFLTEAGEAITADTILRTYPVDMIEYFAENDLVPTVTYDNYTGKEVVQYSIEIFSDMLIEGSSELGTIKKGDPYLFAGLKKASTKEAENLAVGTLGALGVNTKKDAFGAPKVEVIGYEYLNTEISSHGEASGIAKDVAVRHDSNVSEEESNRVEVIGLSAKSSEYSSKSSKNIDTIIQSVDETSMEYEEQRKKEEEDLIRMAEYEAFVIKNDELFNPDNFDEKSIYNKYVIDLKSTPMYKAGDIKEPTYEEWVEMGKPKSM